MLLKGKFKLFIIVALVLLLIVSATYGASIFVLKALYPMKYSIEIEKYCEEYSLNENLYFALIKTESSFDKNAKSSAGALGLTQITPDTFKWLQSKTGEKLENEMLYDENVSLKYGAFFLNLLIKEFANEETALAAYHAGRGQVNKWLRDENVSSDGKTLDYIPFKDTEYYVNRVIRNMGIYEKLYR